MSGYLQAFPTTSSTALFDIKIFPTPHSFKV